MGWDLPASTPGVQLSTASSGCGPASMEEAWKALLKQATSRLKQKFGGGKAPLELRTAIGGTQCPRM